MAKTLKKFENIEELNSYLKSGKLVYTLASAGTAWLIEVDDTSENCSEVFADQTVKKPVGSLKEMSDKGLVYTAYNPKIDISRIAPTEMYLRSVENGADIAKALTRVYENEASPAITTMLNAVIADLS